MPRTGNLWWEDPPYGRQVDQYYAPFSGI